METRFGEGSLGARGSLGVPVVIAGLRTTAGEEVSSLPTLGAAAAEMVGDDPRPRLCPALSPNDWPAEEAVLLVLLP